MAGQTLYQKGINKFSDLTKDEFDNRYHTAMLDVSKPLKNKPKVSASRKLKNRFWDWVNPWRNQEETDADQGTTPAPSPGKQNIPEIIRPSHSYGDIVNWYTAGKVSESVDQGGCGGCWAFVTATTLESLNAI